jgi:hypothetical protein
MKTIKIFLVTVIVFAALAVNAQIPPSGQSLLLSDGSVIEIIQTDKNRFNFSSRYYDAKKTNPERLVECVIDHNWKVVEINNKEQVDPQGKFATVVQPDAPVDSTSSTILSTDILVVRYQNIVNEALKIVFKEPIK